MARKADGVKMVGLNKVKMLESVLILRVESLNGL